MSKSNATETVAPISGHETAMRNVPGRYKIVIGILFLSLIIVSLFWFQQANLLQLRNGQLTSYSSNLRQSLSDLTKIISLQKSQVLADNQTIHWAAGMTSMPLNWTCQCFQYSGYVHVKWSSTENLSLQIVQFGLNFTTSSNSAGDYRVPISSQETFAASFIMASCSIAGGCTGTYSAIYHY